MCLIIYSRDGDLPSEIDFRNAAVDNPDGIGVMSREGIRKFNGRKAVKKAWNHVRKLAHEKIPFGVHFRWATHGAIGRRNTHPFHVKELDLYVMHNGILWTSQYSTDADSDTAVFCEEILPHCVGRPEEDADFLQRIEYSAGPGNKLLVLDALTDAFYVANEGAGTWIGSCWYSNLHSCARKARSPYEAAEYATRRDGRYSGNWLQKRDEAIAAYNSGGDTALAAHWRAIELEDSALAGEYADGREWHGVNLPAKPGIPWKPAAGFDWQDRATWDKYPIPGTLGVYRDAGPINRHGSNEGDEPAQDSDGVALYI